jgi:hypothetical protein
MALNRKFPSECLGFVGVAACDGAHRHALGTLHPRDETARDMRRAEDSDPKRPSSHGRSSSAR